MLSVPHHRGTRLYQDIEGPVVWQIRASSVRQASGILPPESGSLPAANP